MELVVASKQSGFGGKRLLCHLQPQMVVEQVSIGHLERIEWRHHEPHLIEPRPLQNLLGQRDMPFVDGIERASVDADALFH